MYSLHSPVNSQQLKAAVYSATRGVSASAVRRVRAIDPFGATTEEPRGLVRGEPLLS